MTTTRIKEKPKVTIETLQADIAKLKRVNEFLYTQLESIEAQANKENTPWAIKFIARVWARMEEGRIP